VLVKGKVWEVGQWYETGLLKGKKAFLAMTTGAFEKDFQKGEFINMTFDDLLHHITWSSLYYCGIEVLPSFKVFNPGHLTEDQRKMELERFDEYVKNLKDHKKIF
jgi:NAD(P)H dehydrogenase (quinone)